MPDGPSDLIKGEDGRKRCAWAASTPDYLAYHDDEWGRPVGDDDRVYEKLCLEGFQAGLSWLTILRKREAFRHAFARFDPVAVAAFDDDDIEKLLADPGIVRHRGKITAAITNARATMALRQQGVSLAGLAWQHRPARSPVPKRIDDLRPVSPESQALSAELRRHGFAFVGPTTVYSTMQSLGIVNDHLKGCAWRTVNEQQLLEFDVPMLNPTP